MSLALLSSLTPAGADPMQFWLLAGLSVMLFGAAKAGFGGGLAMASTPLMIYACGDAMTAVGLMLPLLIAADYISIAIWWRKWRWQIVVLLLPGMLFGVAIGAGMIVLFRQMESKELAKDWMRLAIGIVATSFVLLHVFQAWRHGPEGKPAYQPTWLGGSVFGLTAGVTSTLAHAAGPVIQMYLLPQKMEKGKFVASHLVFFWICNQIKLIPYFALGLISTPSLGTDAALLPAIGLGAIVGLFAHKRLSGPWFTRVIYSLLGLMGLDLIVRSAMDLLS